MALIDGTFARAAVPSGASTGEHEAVELRHLDLHRRVAAGIEDLSGPNLLDNRHWVLLAS